MRATKQDREKKPYPGFPLFPHPNGQWAKKIRGRPRYFGAISEGWEAALALFEKQRDDLYAGREPRETIEGLTLADLWSLFLEDFDTLVQRGKRGRGSWLDHQRTGTMVVGHLGRNTLVDSLRSPDFKSLRDAWDDRCYAPATIAGHVARVKAVFNWAYQDAELIEVPMRFGRSFRRPPDIEFRQARAEKPLKMFEADEVHRLIAVAKPAMHAMILLGLNAAFLPKDCGMFEFRHVDLAKGSVCFPRTKTAIGRRCQLWPETLEAIDAYLRVRRTPARDYHESRIFITKYGGPFAFEESRVSPVSQQFGKIRKKSKITNRNAFGALRHTFRTIAAEEPSNDNEAIHVVMGHADRRIDDAYIERFPHERIEKVAEYVRTWFLAGAPSESADDAEPDVDGQDSQLQSA